MQKWGRLLSSSPKETRGLITLAFVVGCACHEGKDWLQRAKHSQFCQTLGIFPNATEAAASFTNHSSNPSN